jgi:DNA-binding NtrC family response regulator
MSDEQAHVWFCSPDHEFAQVITSALGPEFEVKLGQEYHLPNDPELSAWWHVVLLDLQSGPGIVENNAPFQLIEQLCGLDLAPPIVVILPHGERTSMLKAMSMGAYDVVESPPNIVEMRLAIYRANRFRQIEWDLKRLRANQSCDHGLCGLIGDSEQIQEVFTLAQRIAACEVSVLITGETGTGKELLARAIHRLSSRAQGPFIGFSCANLPENLVEDELFGHERGAFTGAIGLRRGRFETANQGVLFLDEIGDLPIGLQPKLLRVLQEHSFERLGGNTKITADVRTVCATHRNLEEMIRNGTFREDLYYRLNVVPIHIPPLRDRKGGVAVLARHFLHRFGKQFGSNARRFSRTALQALEEYRWPGNVRELENVIQRAVVLADGPTIEIRHLPKGLHRDFAPVDRLTKRTPWYEEEVRDFKHRLILRTLQECGWNKAEAGRRLNIDRGYLHRLIKQLNIQMLESMDPQNPVGVEPGSRVM